MSVAALAIAELMQQHLLNADNQIDERTSGVFTFLVQSIIALPLIFILGVSEQLFDVFSPKVLPAMLLANLIGSVAMIFYLRSFRVKNISTSNIFISLSIVVSAILGILIFNEGFYFYKLLGLSLVLIAIISLNIKNLHLEKNHYYGLIAGGMFGITYTIDKFVVLNSHPLIYMFWAFLFVAIFGFLISPRSVIRSTKASKANDFKPVLLSGVGYLFYNLFTFSAYSMGGEVGRVDAINNSQVFIVILVEYFIFKHTKGTVRKLLTAIVAGIGVAILGYL